MTAAAAERLGATLARLAPGGRLALAVSGGPDSLALLLLASAARPGQVTAATVDHGLRPEAAGEARAVAAIADRLGVPHTILSVRVTLAGEGMQAAARAARYRVLEDWARAESAPWLLTAHHADDQAETLLMRLARGAGLGGLAGVRERRALGEGLALVRPLLDWRKADLAGVVAEAGLQPVEDPANRDPRHDRTRFRALLAREPLFDPRRLALAAAHLGEAEAALGWMEDRLWRERVTATGATLHLDLADLPPELVRRLLGRALPGARGSAVAALRRRLERVPAATLGGWMVRRQGERFSVAPAPPRRD